MGKAEAYEQVMLLCQQTVTYVAQPGKYNDQPKHSHFAMKCTYNNLQSVVWACGSVVQWKELMFTSLSRGVWFESLSGLLAYIIFFIKI